MSASKEQIEELYNLQHRRNERIKSPLVDDCDNQPWGDELWSLVLNCLYGAQSKAFGSTQPFCLEMSILGEPVGSGGLFQGIKQCFSTCLPAGIQAEV